MRDENEEKELVNKEIYERDEAIVNIQELLQVLSYLGRASRNLLDQAEHYMSKYPDMKKIYDKLKPAAVSLANCNECSNDDD